MGQYEGVIGFSFSSSIIMILLFYAVISSKKKFDVSSIKSEMQTKCKFAVQMTAAA